MNNNFYQTTKYSIWAVLTLITDIVVYVIMPHDNFLKLLTCFLGNWFIVVWCPLMIFGDIIVFNIIDKIRHNTDVEIVKTFGQLKVGDKIWRVSKDDYKDNNLFYIIAIEKMPLCRIRFELLTNSQVHVYLTCVQSEFSSLVSETSSNIFFSNKVIYDKYIEVERKKEEIKRNEEIEVYNNIDVEKGIDEAFSFLKKAALKK